MKKALLLLSAMFLLGACSNAKEPLPNPDPEAKSVKLTKENGGLTGDDSTAAFTIHLAIEGREETYDIEMGPNLYNHHNYDEIVMKKNGYIKSVSTYKVDRLRIDYFSKQGTNFEVLDANNQTVAKHESTYPTDFPDAGDYGEVLEYPIDGTSWTIRNTTDYKPAFYSITVLFTI